MYANYCPRNCCFTEYYKLNHCCNFQPSNCVRTFPTTYPCSCYHPIKRFPQSYQKLSAMPPKLNTPSESSTSKNSTKLKKKAPKTKRGNKSSVKANQTKIGDDAYPKTGYSENSSVRMSLSESVVGRKANARSANGVKSSESYCNYECFCRPLKSCRGKSGINFTLLTHNGVPIKQTYHGYSERQPAVSYTLKSDRLKQDRRNSAQQQQYYYNTLDNLQVPPNRKSVSNDSFISEDDFNRRGFNDPRSLYFSQNIFEPRASYDSPNSSLSQKKQKDSITPKCSACLSCQHSRTSINKCSAMSPTRSQPCKCSCKLCRKISHTQTNLLRQARHSFSTSKSCPQLDVINEEEPENEDSQNFQNKKSRYGHTEAHTTPKAHTKPIVSDSTKREKSLEDSCADFLSIVCDNILESVQKSVDHKLREFSSKSTENFEGLAEKLEKSEKSVQSLCSDMIAKITEQNQNNFQQIYSLVQELAETRTVNQYPMKTNSYQDRECQCEPVLEEENYIVVKPLENNIIVKPLHLGEDNDGSEIKLVEITTNDKNERQKCTCCHCNDETNSADTLVAHKSNSSSTDTHNLGHNAYVDSRQSGGCMDCGKNKEVEKQEDVSVLVLDSKCSPKEQTSPRRREEEIKTIRLPLKCLQPSGISPRTLFGKDKCKEVDKRKEPSKKYPPADVASTAAESTSQPDVSKEEEIIIMGLPLKCPLPTVSSPRTSFGKNECKEVEQPKKCHPAKVTSQRESISSQKPYVSQRDSTPPRYTTFSLSPSGKTTFNCNCMTDYSDGSGNISICVCKGSNTSNDKSLDLNMECQNLYDNYDTSGYATEPEDNNEGSNCNSGRKKLQKKASKQHCNSQSTVPLSLENINTINRRDNCSEKHDSQPERRASKINYSKSCNSSPTRLSRL